MKNNKKAFTLIELLVVVLIIGILSAVALPQYTFAVEKARFAEAQSNIASLQRAVDIWLLENGYPSSSFRFLGDSANASGELAVDLESGLDCSAWGGIACAGKNFIYTATCNPTNYCGVYATREIDGNTVYEIGWSNKSGQWRGSYCNYPEEGSVGEKICKMLKAQDDNFELCEGC